MNSQERSEAQVAYLDPYLFGVFRSKMSNPACMWQVYQHLKGYSFDDLRNPERAGVMVDRLSTMLGVPVTAEQRASAVNWLCCCGVDPANPVHQRRMWNLIIGI